MKNWLDAQVAYASGDDTVWQQQSDNEEQQMSEGSGFRNMYSSGDHLKASDIKGRGDIPVIIDRWEVKKFDEGDKIVVGFHNKQKTFVLNKTNYETIADTYGDHPEHWIGKHITLFAMRVQGPQGNTVDAIRCRATPVGNAPPAQPQQTPPGAQRFDTPPPAAPAPPPAQPPAGFVSEPFDDDIPF